MKVKYPFVLLIFLSPVTAELLSGSTPFFKFFKPFVFLVYVGFYGLGALLAREIVAHKNLNYASVLLLGAALGVSEEGIILKSWFDPTWMGAAITSDVLRVYGISILQPFANVCYHAVVSIAAPIVLVDSVSSKNPWVLKRDIVVLGVLFVVSALLLSGFNDYAITPGHYLFGIVLFVVFCVMGLKGTKISGKKICHPVNLWVLGSIFVVLLFFIFYGLSNAGFSWVVILGMALILYVIYGSMYANTSFEPRHYFAAAAGIITGLLPIVALMTRTDPAKTGNMVAALIFTAALGLVYIFSVRDIDCNSR
jgi:hypothetical protein